MLIKPDDATTRVLAQLGQTSEWEAFEAWLRKSRESCIATSCCESDAKSRQAQGAIMVIDSLIRNTRAAVELSTRR